MRFGIKRRKRTKTIGICGADGGCGTTHIAVAIAGMYCSRFAKRVAFLEFEKDTMVQMVPDVFEFEGGRYRFTDNNIDYYTPAGHELFSTLMREGRYDYIIVDFGIIKSTVSQDFLQCDQRFITMSLSRFRINNAISCLRNNKSINTPGLSAFLVNTGDHKEQSRVEKEFGTRCRKMPYIADPFKLTERNTKELLAMLK